MTTYKRFSTSHACTAVLAFLACFGSIARAVFIPEPATVFYGKVIGTAGEQPFLVTSGTMTWTILRSSGAPITLRATLQPLNSGEFSYRLNVPHEALVAGITNSGTTVGLALQAETHSHVQIAVDGLRAQIIGPNGNSFDAAQALRSTTYRLDLQVPLTAADADGNGLPDWWEALHGISDANGDADGDGVSNLAEYRAGTNPRRNDRLPTLATREVRAYADGTTALLLRAIDTDSAAANLTYTLTLLPEVGTLYLRNANQAPNTDTALGIGSSFSQADVVSSRVIYVHATNEAITPTRFQVVLRDEDATHAASTNDVRIHFYRPADAISLATVLPPETLFPLSLSSIPGISADEQAYAMAHTLSRDLGYVVLDASSQVGSIKAAAPSSGTTLAGYTNQFVASFGRDRRHVFIGAPGADQLTGSMEPDIFVAGAGNDTLRGNAGPDLFVISSRNDGTDTIEDFNAAEDTIDLSQALTGGSLLLNQYLQLTATPSNTTLRVNSDGTGAPYSSLAIVLPGLVLNDEQLFDLVEQGRIVTGDKANVARISIAASASSASENGPASGYFTLTRRGSVLTDLTVQLQVSGSAANGTDYRYVPAQVTFPAGTRSLTIEIAPYVDATTELTEVVDIRLLAGSGYTLGSSVQAQVNILDLMPQIAIEALEPTAVKADQIPGACLITRSGVIDRSVLVRLNIGGTAANGSDYQTVSSFISLGAYETTAVIPITPKTTALLSNGVEFVSISLRPDAAYRLGNPTNARVTIVEQQLDLLAWRDRYFAGEADDLLTFAARDTGNTGIRNFDRYAFGLDPRTPQPSRGAPVFKIRDNHMVVTYRRPASVLNVTYQLEVSDNLVTWHSGEQWWESFSAPEYANDVEMVSFRSVAPVSATPKLFMRVRTIYTP